MSGTVDFGNTKTFFLFIRDFLFRRKTCTHTELWHHAASEIIYRGLSIGL